jgi:CBS domain-containing protein
MRYELSASDIMTRKPVTATPKITVSEGLKIMLAKHVGSLVIVENNSLKGIVTETDLLEKVLAKNKDPRNMTMSDVMTKKLITIGPGEDIRSIAEIMTKRDVRRLPVVENKKLIGLVTIKDVLKAEPHIIDVLINKMKVREPHFDIKEEEIEGVCEICGNYSDSLKEKRGRLVCDFCADEI